MVDIELKFGGIIIVYCLNMGLMIGVFILGSNVMVFYSNNLKWKLVYIWELIEVIDNELIWVGINMVLLNRVIKLVLVENLFFELGDYYEVKMEVVYGKDRKSRVDFKLISEIKNIYFEVKNIIWVDGRVVLFLDMVIKRG